MSVHTLLRSLGYAYPSSVVVPKEGEFHHKDVVVEPVDESTGRYLIERDGLVWHMHTKVVLKQDQLYDIGCIAMRFAPPGSTVSMQADTHNAGMIFVGMIMTFGEQSIPICLPNADVGCGVTVIPVVVAENQLRITDDKAKDDDFHSYALAKMRSCLIRGRAAEEGYTLNKHLKDAAKFYGDDELGAWLDEMRWVLDMMGFITTVGPTLPSWAVRSLDEYAEEQKLPQPDGLSVGQTQTLKFIGRYAQSLGCSGNHFMELSTDSQGYYWLVVHSGSRGLGAKVYDVIAQACRVVNHGYEIATGKLAEFYTVAYRVLNKFAKLNRVLCAISVLKGLETINNFAYETSVLKKVMRESHLFAPAIDKCGGDDSAALSLMSGLTHNGIKAFVNHDSKGVLYVLSKGAVAMSKRASASIVALRAGDGCYLWTLADLNCPWHEVDVSDAIKLHYTPVFSADDVIYSGHGAGRSQSATKTEKASTFADLLAFYDEHGMAGNIAPGVLGDNPRIAYNTVPEILKHLPLDIACTKSQLRTRVTYKEGICYKQQVVAQCAKWMREEYINAEGMRRLWFDVNVTQGKCGLDKDEHTSIVEDQRHCMDEYEAQQIAQRAT